MNRATLTRSSIAMLLLAVAACQAAPPTASEDTGKVTSSAKVKADPQAKAAQLMRDTGLESPTVSLEANQFQLRDLAGQPIEGAVLQVGEERLTSDAQGIVTMQTSLPQGQEYLVAIAQATGIVPSRIKVVPRYSVRLHPANGDIHSVTAEKGGKFANADGTIEVTFSPGALNKDAQVRVTRIYEAQPSSVKAVSPGFDHIDTTKFGDNLPLGRYSYALDLGGAEITPGASVRVNFKAEPPLKEFVQTSLKNNPTGFSMKDLFSVSANGDVHFAMMVPAPAAEPPLADLASKAFRLMNAVCNQPNDPENYTVQVCTSRQVQDCVDHGSQLQIHDPAMNNGHCVYMNTNRSCSEITVTSCTNETRTRYHQSSTINARVMYSSNDSRYSGQAASGARVSFSHVGTPVRAPGSTATAGSTGYCWVYGAANAGGSATASMPGDAGSYGTIAGYSVNCGTVNLSIVKNMPRVTFAFSNNGSPLNGSYSRGTSHGDQGFSGFSNVTRDIAMKAATAASEGFTLTGANFAMDGGQVDMNDAAGTIGWNQDNTINLTVYHNKPVSSSASYASDDASVPDDQQPTIKWNGQSASDLAYQFTHNVSASSKKPAGRDQLSFNNVNTASTWGLNGASTSVTATRTFNGVSLSGVGTGTVNGGNVPVQINANLPKMTINFAGSSQGAWILNYRVTDSSGVAKNRTTSVTPAGGKLVFSLPVEEAVNNPLKHTMQLDTILSQDGTYSLSFEESANTLTFNYPAMGNLQRGQVYTYPHTLKSSLIAPK
ncbi:MAG: hypothetical protein VKP62_01340 [Candidatus Sericytochromatia bacterium]|nr:hypothetical protein [Candidatus Sericytochromatia bacterium]